MAQAVVVALAQQFAGGGLILAGQDQGQHLVLQSLAPDFIQIGRAGGPGRVLAIHVQGFVHIETKPLLQQGLDAGGPLRQPAQIDVENVVGRVQVAFLQGIVQGIAIPFEAGNVAGQEIGTAEVEVIEIRGQDERGQPVVQAALPIMVLGQQFGDGPIQRGMPGRRHQVADGGDSPTRSGRFGERPRRTQRQNQRQQDQKFQSANVVHAISRRKRPSNASFYLSGRDGMDQNNVGGDRLLAVRFGQGELEQVVTGRQLHDIETFRQAGVMKKRRPVGGIRVAGIGFP